jgi:hypothetical protein
MVGKASRTSKPANTDEGIDGFMSIPDDLEEEELPF